MNTSKFFHNLKHKKWLIVGGIILAILLGVVVKNTMSSSNKKSQYQTAKVERGMIVSSISNSGKVLTSNTVEIITDATGVVKKVYVKDDQVVKKGQKIAEVTLDQQGQQKNAQAWASYLSAKNAVESAKATAFSLKSEMLTKWDTYMGIAQSANYQNDDGSPKNETRALPEFHIAYDNWLAAQAKYTNQEAVLTQAQAAANSNWLAYQSSASVITAPLAGRINSMSLVEGMVLGSATDQSAITQRVAVIQNKTQPLIQVNTTEVDISRVAVGQSATVTLDSVQGKTFSGKVMTVDRIGTISSNVTSYPALVQLDQKQEAFLPNMSVNVSIIVDTKQNTLIVPSAAVQTRGESSFVQVLKDGKVQRVSVTIGISSDTHVEILSGLSEGEEVVVGTMITSSTQQPRSVFNPGFGGAALRPGGGSVSNVRGR